MKRRKERKRRGCEKYGDTKTREKASVEVKKKEDREGKIGGGGTGAKTEAKLSLAIAY